VTKSNLAAMPEALAYRLVTEEEYGVARVIWDGATSHKAADLLRLPARDDQEDAVPARVEAEEVLREILAEGPVPARKVKALARDAGIAERTLDRARQAIGAITRREGFGPGSRFLWALPEGSIPATEQPSTPLTPSSPVQESLAPMASMEADGEDEWGLWEAALLLIPRLYATTKEAYEADPFKVMSPERAVAKEYATMILNLVEYDPVMLMGQVVSELVAAGADQHEAWNVIEQEYSLAEYRWIEAAKSDNPGQETP
jgi:hypothetical protein